MLQRSSAQATQQSCSKYCFVQLLPTNIKLAHKLLDQDESHAAHLHDTVQISQESFDVLCRLFAPNDVSRFSGANDVASLRYVFSFRNTLTV
jgi:hypothetical protein